MRSDKYFLHSENNYMGVYNMSLEHGIDKGLAYFGLILAEQFGEVTMLFT